MLDLLRTKLDKALEIMYREQLNSCLVDSLSTQGDEYTFMFLVLFSETDAAEYRDHYPILTEPRTEPISPGLIDITVCRYNAKELWDLKDVWNKKADDNQVRWKGLTKHQLQRLQDSFRAEIHALRLSLDQYNLIDVDGSEFTDDTCKGFALEITLGVPMKQVDFGITV